MEIITNKMTGYEEGSDRFQIGRIRVWPRTDDIRKYIRHPLGDIKFRATLTDSVEWPFDQFTKRRIKDGTVLTEAPVIGDAEPPPESLDLPQA
jgi:hypothetical protein